ncbi:hypothetical protein WQ54_28740 [Bacillus sp. SA1-12]|nr:hypothetical protein WQ54_28740 [Bacillus sp. SA1-12]
MNCVLKRKYFRIYFNTSIHGKSPTHKELMRWTGKLEADVRVTIISLSEGQSQNFIAKRIKVI